MRARYKVLIFSVALGLLIWIVNAAIDAWIYEYGSLIEMLLTKLTPLQTGHRIVYIIALFVFGIYIYKLLEKRKQVYEALDKQKQELDKKVSELDTLVNISNFMVREDNIGLMLLGIANLIKPAFKYPEMISIRIRYLGKTYESSSFYESDNTVIFDIYVFGKITCKLEVIYRNSSPDIKISNDEAELIQVVSDRIGKTLERRIATGEMRESREQLRALTAHLHSSLEKERISISREIHDELGQVLTALKINLTLLEKHLQQKEQDEETEFLSTELRDMESIIDITIKKVRKLITNLRPEVLDNLGLIEALEWQSAEFQKNTGIKCNFTGNVDSIELDKDITTAIFRIYQEALTNVARHSRATIVKSRFVKNPDSVLLLVSDNGIGINKAKLSADNSFGILGMKERAIICGGTIEFESNEDSGTTVMLNIPYKY